MSLSSRLKKTLKLARPYETVDSIKDMTVEEILSIEPHQINTTKIVDDPKFEKFNETKKNAVKYIATRKRVRRSNNTPYKNIVEGFKAKYGDKDVDKEIFNAYVEVNDEMLDDARFLSSTRRRLDNLDEADIKRRLNELDESEKRRSKKGGKGKKTKKRRAQSRRR